jgi:hypothetical protein
MRDSRSVCSCRLVYSGLHLGQIDKCDFILVLRSKPRRSMALEMGWRDDVEEVVC